MKPAQIVAMQKRIGVIADGFWGPKSIHACQIHLLDLMPHPNPWPKSSQAALQSFYGSPGDESNLISMPVPVPLSYEGSLVKTIRVHHRCAESLGRALVAAYAVAPSFAGVYDGCYNDRPMRGASIPSLHARGAAIDLAASVNGNLVSWPAAAAMPIEVMECFAREGWIAAGAFWGRDAMHFEATR